MRLQRLLIQGFKSFKDRTTIEFDEGITGIIGPNGCGKSNIVDALFWVMGEQSAKHLRGNSMKDVIFSGTSKFPPASFAEVTLVLSNEEGKHIHILDKIVSPTDIQLTRKLYRDGETEYRINGVICRLKDIQEIFMDTGAGAKSYSIIAQGEINKLIQAKPEERRTIIEEVAGITKFKVRKKESVKKLDRAQDNLSKVVDLKQEVGKQLKILSHQAEKALKARDLKEKIKKSDLTLEAHREFDLLTKWISSFEEKEVLEKKSQEVQLKKVNLETECETELLKKSELEAALQQARSLKLELSKQLAAKEERLRLLDKSIEDKEKSFKQRQQELSNIEEQQEELESRLEESSGQCMEKEEEVSSLEEEIGFLLEAPLVDEEVLRDLKRQQESLKKDDLLIEKENKDLQQKIFVLDRDYEDLSTRLDEYQGELEKIEREDLKYHDDLKKISLQQQDLELQKTKSREIIESLESRLKESQTTFQEISTELKMLEEKQLFLRTQIKSLEEIENKKLFLPDDFKIFADEQGNLCSIESMVECSDVYLNAVNGSLSFLNVPLTFLEREEEHFFQEDLSKAPSFGLLSLLENRKEDREKVVSDNCFVSMSSILRTRNEESLPQQKLEAFFYHFFIGENISRQQAHEFFAKTNAALLIDKSGTFLFLNLEGVVLYLSLPKNIEISETAVGRKMILSSMKEELKTFDEELVKKKEEYHKEERIHLDIQDQLSLQEKKKNELSIQMASLETTLHHTKDLVETPKARKRVLQQKMEEASLLRAQRFSEKEKKEIELQEQVIKKDLFEEKKVFLHEEIEKMSHLFSEMKEKKLILEMNLKNTREGLLLLEKQHKNILQEKEKLLNRFEENQEFCDSFQEELMQRKIEIDELKKDNFSLNETLETSTVKLSLLEDGYNEVMIQLGDSDKLLKSYSSDLSKFEKEIVALQLKMHQIKEEEFLVFKNSLEVYQVNVRQSMKDEIEKISLLYEDWKDDDSLYLQLDDEGKEKEIIFEEFKFTRRYGKDLVELKERLKRYKKELSALGEINYMAIDDYDRVKERMDFLEGQEEELRGSMENLNEAIRLIDEKSKIKFNEAYEEVNLRFSKVFPILFMGGSAQLKLTGDLDSNECGIDIMASPPGKKMQSINLMSGGEKAMTAVALIFSIFLYRPSPFSLLDEVDAPLDDANVERFNELLHLMGRDCQFILITHNKKTMELNNSIYGITMPEPGVSKVVSVKIKDHVKEEQATQGMVS